ncbi:hypothetical protein HDO13_004743 [Escherichia coli]|uniref:type II toxin-antitoxin system RelE/ParE family toxin n=2 Tax=Escherichia TaxID=561 RepID=UPI000F89A411|nr:MULTISPECIES: type II toxin-antitoxin system RelE/ParE family toxin [Escherichia]EDA5892440.1 hypothetical protein [Salmonella enterica subsp. enterica serovar Kaapstad]EFM1532499.1 hypothetical protein [Escherichia coli]TLI93719.1 hypothetical protein FEK49_24000 [Escherichia sp. E4385]HAW0914572.1 hypothetical protein [Escherichia coli]HCB2501563.1 type II toxin-antitoxin system RelE/ParE family toxin [Escherichia coli]
MKEIVYVGGAEKDLKKSFTKAMFDEVLVEIVRLQCGIQPIRKTKPMNGLGKGVMEWTKNGKPAYRLVYVVGKEQIFILHAFSKTSDGTPKSEEETIKERYKQISKIV